MLHNSRERTEKYLYRQLMLLAGGQKLPSVRATMMECGVSQSIVQDVLKKYESDGLIQSSDRRGYFKSDEDSAVPSFEELDLVYCTTAKDEDPLLKFHGDFSHLLGKLCGESWRSVRFHFLEGNAELRRIEQLARNSRCRACIIVASPSREIGAIMKKHHVAYVNLFPGSFQLDDEAVNVLIDNEAVIRAQLDFLTGLGHRRIGYIHSIREEEPIRDLFMRRDAFMRQSLAAGLPLDPGWIRFGGYDSDTSRAAMGQILEGADRPTAVIAFDHHIPGIYQALHDRGLVPGRDMSVLGTDNLSISRIVSPQASSLEISRADAAVAAMRALESTLRGEAAERKVYVPLSVIGRQSTRPLGESA